MKMMGQTTVAFCNIVILSFVFAAAAYHHDAAVASPIPQDDPFADPEENPFGNGPASDDPFADGDPFGGNDSGTPDQNPFGDAPKNASKTTKTKRSKQTENIRRIEVQLSKRTEIDFDETPLTDVVEILKEQHDDIPIVFDYAALDLAGISSNDINISQTLDGVSLNAALRIILKQHDLTFVLRDEVLQITTIEEAEENLITKVYSITDLIDRKSPETVSKSVDMLTDTVCSNVSPESWDQVGGTGSVTHYRGHLVVSQVADVHDRLTGLLSMLRQSIEKHGGLDIPLPARQMAGPAQGGGFGGGSMGGGYGGAEGMNGDGYGMEASRHGSEEGPSPGGGGAF